MARFPRSACIGEMNHVTARANDDLLLFRDAADACCLLVMLGRIVRKYRWTAFAYCLMPNHFHLVVRADPDDLSNGMRDLCCGYARRTNLKYGRRNHLFGDRFTTTPVEDDAHLLQACRYVWLNPVRARLCKRPADWVWSSYRAAAGIVVSPVWLATDAVVGLFGTARAQAIRALRAYVREGHVPVTVTVTEVRPVSRE